MSPLTDDSDGGKVHHFLGAEIGSLIVCTSEGCHRGTVQSDGRHLLFAWETKQGEPAREILLADPAD
jgi:hypothetical protein